MTKRGMPALLMLATLIALGTAGCQGRGLKDYPGGTLTTPTAQNGQPSYDGGKTDLSPYDMEAPWNGS